MNANTLPEGAVLSSGTNQYRIVRVLGSGGFGITYLATSKRKLGNIPVTVNFAIKEHFMSDYCERDGATNRVVTGPGKQRETVENSKKDFIGEALRLQKIADGHPSIVKVNEVFEANGTAYYVMEYLDGQSLRRYVEENGPLNEWQAHSLLDPIAEAVDYLHSQRLTHLDIKPDNIMLTNDEDANGNPILRPVLIDFGLSKHYDASGRATSTINTLGCSDGYAPIEQYAGITTFSPSADIYALAATWLFCLTAHDPKKSTELFRENIDAKLAAILPPVSPQHRALLVAALSVDSSNRPASLLQFTPPTPPAPPAPDPNPTIVIDPQPDVPASAPDYEPSDDSSDSRKPSRQTILTIAGIVLAVLAISLFFLSDNSTSEDKTALAQEEVQAPVDSVTEAQEEVAPNIAPVNEVAQAKEEVQAKTEDRTYGHKKARHLDLATKKNGEYVFFTTQEWDGVPKSEKSQFKKMGVVINQPGIAPPFILALNDNGKDVTWDEAMASGINLPTKTQGEAIVKDNDNVTKAVNNFGGTIDSRDFWTKTEYDSSHAWSVAMHYGSVGTATKSGAIRVRAVAPVPSSAM